uniref:Glycosyltransferase n=1 Tax=Thermodesulfobacterium geofontis TaxID=1295609 RepID=A0A7C4NU86_9BACT
MNKKKIIFIIPNLSGGGAERVCVNIYNELSKYENYNIFLVLFQNIVKYDIPFDNIILINTPGSSSILGKIQNFFIRLYKLSRIKKEINPHVSVSFLEQPDLLNILTKSNKHKIILSIRNYMTKYFKEMYNQKIRDKIIKLIYRFSYRTLSNKADLIVCVSKGVAEDLIENYGVNPDKIKVIYNPILLRAIEKQAYEPLEDYNLIFNNPVLITTGRLTKQKGQWYLLRIFKVLKEKYKDLKFVILGEGELKHYLVDLSEKLELKTFIWDRDKVSENFDVYFLGFQKNPFKFIARSKLFVFPSLWEGFGNALVEAMACGVPVVSSDCRSGPREILAPSTDFNYQTDKPEFAEYGILMPVFEIKYKSAKEPLEKKERMWVEVIDRILEDEELRSYYSMKSKERARDFAVEKIVKEWNNILTSLMHD